MRSESDIVDAEAADRQPRHTRTGLPPPPATTRHTFPLRTPSQMEHPDKVSSRDS